MHYTHFQLASSVQWSSITRAFFNIGHRGYRIWMLHDGIVFHVQCKIGKEYIFGIYYCHGRFGVTRRRFIDVISVGWHLRVMEVIIIYFFTTLLLIDFVKYFVLVPGATVCVVRRYLLFFFFDRYQL